MAMFTNKRIMVVAAHPDDELLGLVLPNLSLKRLGLIPSYRDL